MHAKSIVIFAALKIETNAIERALMGIRRPVHVHTVGIGAIGVPSVLPKDIGVLMMAGMGGALDPSLKIGDIVLDDPKGIVPADLPVRRGKICTADALVATPAAKAELFQSTAALAVDMEQQHLHKLAAKRGVALIGVRSISDTADQTLDPKLLKLVDAVGRPKPVALGAALFEKPMLALEMNKLGKNIKIATDKLGAAVRLIVQSLPM
jgi:hypothetical protein